MLVLVNFKHHAQNWFWGALSLALIIHGCVVYSFRQLLPSSDIGALILISAPEVLLLQLIFRMSSVR